MTYSSSQRLGKKQTTASALLMHKGRFLVHFHKKIGKWLYPGGHVELNEEPQDAVVREVLEETGLQVRVLSASKYTMGGIETIEVSSLPVPFAILAERIKETAKEEEHWHIDMVYLCVCKEKDISMEPLGDGFQWVTVNEIKSMNSPDELHDLMLQAESFLKYSGPEDGYYFD